MNTPAILLYGFTPQETGTLQTLLQRASVRIVSVPQSAYGLTLSEVLAGKAPGPLQCGAPMERKLLVLCHAEGPMFHMLLWACAQATGKQRVLRAMLTDTNRDWTGAYLYAHLLEEEAELAALQGKE